MSGQFSVAAVNAVVVDAQDHRQIEKILHRQFVLSVEALESLGGVKVDGVVINVGDRLTSATEDLRRQVDEAITEHEERQRSKLVRPDWLPVSPTVLEVPQGADLVTKTLTHANFLKARWQEWLNTEKHRVRRSRSPVTGETPYIMPSALSQLVVRALPIDLGAGHIVIPLQQSLSEGATSEGCAGSR